MNLLIGFLLVLISPLCLAQSIIVEQAFKRYNVLEEASIYLDSDGLFDIHKINRASFSKRAVETLNLESSKTIVWLKFTVTNQTEYPLRLIKNMGLFNKIELYQQVGPDSFIVSSIDECIPYNSKDILHPVDQFNLNIKKGDPQTYYLSLQTNEILKINFFISSFNDAIIYSHQEDLLVACFLSIFLVMFFYNLFIFIQTRDRGYLYYVIYILNMALAQLADRGYSDLYLWPNNSFLKQIDIIVFTSFTFAAAIIFVINFLQIKRLLASYYQALIAFLVLTFLPILVALTGHISHAYTLINILLPSSSIFLLYISFKIYNLGYKPARFFLLGWTVMIVATFLISIYNMGWLPSNFFIKNGFVLGSLIEIILISWALGDKINGYKKIRDKAVYEKEMILIEQNEKLEKLVAIRTNELNKNLIVIGEKNKEKEILLKEIHHRVKNNLQIISSLLSIQNKTNKDPKVQENIVSSQRRINSIAVIHEMLYQSDNIARIEFNTYLEKLVGNLINTLKKENQLIHLEIEATDIYMNLETAIPLGLIINEVVTNALKYAFADRKNGTISIQIEPQSEQKYILYIGDNGIGIPKDFDPLKSKSLGSKLIQSLSYQMSGQAKLDNSKVGTNYVISFKKIETK